MKYKKWQILEIDWLDSVGTNGWRHEERLDLDDKYLYHKTVGYFFAKTRLGLTVVQSKSNNGEEESTIDNAMTIPNKVITKIKILK